MNLRDALLSGLKSLPGTREFHIHVLISSPRKHAKLFPFAIPRPRCTIQDILILLSEQATPESPRIFVAGIEASVYTVPSTSCGILYISKVDTTGQSTIKPSPAATLVRSLIGFYCDPATRPIAVEHVWVQLFARAQGQYLFPNSAEWEGKKPLSDVKLCAWWKRRLGEVAGEMVGNSKEGKVMLYWELPGFSELEALNAVQVESSSSSWTYGHPYSQSEIPLPCPGTDDHNLGHFIPWFEDCPKSRFIDEIAYTTEESGVKSPPRKRMRMTDASTTTTEKEKEDVPLGELGKVTADEFWERMSFRQECVAGAVTGFFTLVCSSPAGAGKVADSVGQVSGQISKRIMSSLLTGVEFSTVERAIRGTETMEGAMKGLCESGYEEEIYGSACVRNRTSAKIKSDDGERVTVLRARKKRKL